MEMIEKSFYTLLLETASQNPSRIAFVYKGEETSFETLIRDIDAYAGTLHAAGVKEGDHVALYSFNSPLFMAAFFAIIRLGAVATLVNYSLPEEDVVSLCQNADVTCMIYGETALSAKDSEAVHRIMERLNLPRDCRIDLGKIQAARESVAELPPEPFDVKQFSCIIFTSVTIYVPLAVLLSLYGSINNADSMYKRMGERMKESFLISVPLFHIFGLQMTLIALFHDATAYLPEKFKPDVLVEMIDRYQISAMATVGAVYNALLEAPEFSRKVAPVVHIGFIAGGFSTPVQFMKLETAFDDIRILNAYGQTETSPCISMHSPDTDLEKRVFNVGHALPGVELAILDGAGNQVPDGTVGEIAVRGYLCMNGYYKLPPKKQPFDENGWLHTGDMGLIAGDGSLALVGRLKDIIIKSGENILPVEIEQVLSEHPLVREAKVFGAPHPIWGESVEACVVLAQPCVDDKAVESMDEELRAYVKKELGSFKVPSHFFHYEEFPLNANGKMDVRGLKTDMLNKLKDHIFAEDLRKGIRSVSMTIKSIVNNIGPVTALFSSFASNMKYDPRMVSRISLSVEEMLTERIRNAYVDVGDISITFVLLEGWIRIGFRDHGLPYRIMESKENSLSARIILAEADNYVAIDEKDGGHIYCIDFKYPEGFDVKEFVSRAE